MSDVDPKALLKKLMRDNPGASAADIKEAWMELVNKDDCLTEAVFRETFEHFWQRGARSVDEMVDMMKRKDH